MKCPVDNETLVMSERSGVEVDYCPKCRGVWLDRGELDKILERSAAEGVGGHRPQVSDQRAPREVGGYPQKKKKSSLLSELFDF